MIIAIPTEGNQVSGHFGFCPHFTLITIENGKITNKTTLENPGHEPGFLPGYLHEHNVNCIIAGGMGGRAQQLFAQNGIEVVTGAAGDIDTVVEQYCAGNLISSGETCSNHEHSHDCGSHDHHH